MSHPSLESGRFLPGAVLGGRYRVMGMLGRGGMGEVYRADDLRLGQPVALKFLPPELENDSRRLGLMLDEVKVALKVTHPNVCRVHDIGEVDGHHYISMEYVDGENLASLLRRIGRLPEDKAVQIARQICAGVSAAHDQGVLHRDLKPANVMIDGRGQAKITDFGLAGLEEGFTAEHARSGTPAYMSPEQLAGREVTTRSDIYALGLLLYELFTGKSAFAGRTPEEIARLQSDSSLTNPSELVAGLDPAVERVILRCLESEPADRPSSIVAVSAALPGGDPLAAALAAGETPSPELVAASGRSGVLSPRVAMVHVSIVIACFALAIAMNAYTPLHETIGGMLPPSVLENRAREILTGLGHDDPPLDSARGIDFQPYVLQVLAGPIEERARKMAADQPNIGGLWYRQSPDPLRPIRSTVLAGPEGDRVSPGDPPFDTNGEAKVWLSLRGRLTSLEVVSDHFARDVPEGPGDSGAEPATDADAVPAEDWAAAMEYAGFSLEDLTEVEPIHHPHVPWETRRAWTGVYPEAPEVDVRIEAAALGGRVVAFEVFEPWDLSPIELPAALLAAWTTGGSMNLVAFIGGAILAFRNVRGGRGDRRGANRLALVAFGAMMLIWLIEGHHTDLLSEPRLFFSGVGNAATQALFVWLLYVGLEPHVRRYLPTALVSWSRLLSGRWKDPLVGRDILYALTLTSLFWASSDLWSFGRGFIGINATGIWQGLGPTASLVARHLGTLVTSTGVGLVLVFLFVVIHALLPRIIARVIYAFLFFVVTAVTNPQFLTPLDQLVISALMSTVALVAIFRHGLLTYLAMGILSGWFSATAFTMDSSVWYFPGTVLMIVLIAALTFYGYRISTAGQALFREEAESTMPS